MRESLRHFLNKSKLLKEEILIVVLIILVGTASFGLGRLSAGRAISSSVRVVSGNQEGVAVNEALANVSAAPVAGAADGKVVASKNGKVYHLPWCPGALKIKPENLITFDSSAAAAAAGLTPASNCKGL
ncbi:MAG: hypothetical protein Q7S34_03745 [bacterium]|nr:hypothetical protein [bacterium]